MRNTKMNPIYKKHKRKMLKTLEGALDDLYDNGNRCITKAELKVIELVLEENLKHPDFNNIKLLTKNEITKMFGKDFTRKNGWHALMVALWMLSLLDFWNEEVLKK